MGMQFLAKAIQHFQGGTDEVGMSLDKQKNLLVAQGNPGYAETRRRGEGWNCMLATVSEALVVQATTLAHLEMHNNGTRLAVVSDLHIHRLLGTAVGVGDFLWVQVTTKAIPTLGALVQYSMSGKAATTPTATSEMVTGIDTTVVADGWMAYGFGTGYLAAATPGAGGNIPVDGKLIIPPGCSLCIAIASSVNTASAMFCGVTYDWINATVEA